MVQRRGNEPDESQASTDNFGAPAWIAKDHEKRIRELEDGYRTGKGMLILIATEVPFFIALATVALGFFLNSYIKPAH